jgi:error-prone DNA polymerase
MVGAFDTLGELRRKLLWGWQERWHGRGLRRKLDSQSELQLPADAPTLPQISDEERTRLEYRISNPSTGRHLVEFYRENMRALGALTSAEANRQPEGSRIRVAGLVITRQAPSTAGKIRFFTLEDEHGHVNVTIKPDVYQRYRREAAQPILAIDGVVQSQDRVWSLPATAIAPLPNAHSESTQSHDYR